YFIAGVILLAITHISSFILVAALVFFLVLVTLEKLPYHRAELEGALFATFFTVWLTLIFFKQVLLAQGVSVLHENVPAELLGTYFLRFDLFSSIALLGILPVAFGIYTIYRYVFREPHREIYLYASLAFVILLLLWNRQLRLEAGLMFLALILSVLSSQAFKVSLNYLAKTKAAHFMPAIIGLLVLAITATSALPAVFGSNILASQPTTAEVAAYEWLKNNTQPGSVVLSIPEDGLPIQFFSQRATVTDTNFLLVRDAAQRLEATRRIYRSQASTQALPDLTRYDVDYIMVSPRIMAEYGRLGD
ncbi:hypothetical protein J4475_02795, partial [Candidatus Woesearchaeota archaeon]|nr:hypothetical protein [Candidatus Woesearchaeota archaeon]